MRDAHLERPPARSDQHQASRDAADLDGRTAPVARAAPGAIRGPRPGRAARPRRRLERWSWLLGLLGAALVGVAAALVVGVRRGSAPSPTPVGAPSPAPETPGAAPAGSSPLARSTAVTAPSGPAAELDRRTRARPAREAAASLASAGRVAAASAARPPDSLLLDPERPGEDVTARAPAASPLDLGDIDPGRLAEPRTSRGGSATPEAPVPPHRRLRRVGRSLTTAQIMAVATANRHDLEACYDPRRGRAPSKLELRVAVAPRGDVRRVWANDVEPALAACVVQRVRTWRFPATRGRGDQEIEVPVILVPGQS